MSKSLVHRCPTCKTKCPKTIEDKLRTPSQCVLVEVNQFTRKAARSEFDEKIRTWENAVPPVHLSIFRYAVSMITLENVKFLRKGFNLTEKQETLPLDIRNEDESTKSRDVN